MVSLSCADVNPSPYLVAWQENRGAPHRLPVVWGNASPVEALEFNGIHPELFPGQV